MAKSEKIVYYGTGRRKSSVARVRIVEGTGKIRTITPKAELEKHIRNNMKETPLNVKRLVLGGVIAAGVISNIMDGGQQTNAQLFGQQPY